MASDQGTSMAKQRVVLVTGPSGAGRSTAIKALEDLGFETIDNIPLSLIPRLVGGEALPRPLALGLDVRNRDFSAQGVIALRDMLEAELLYLDAAPEILTRRYSETRRRHPLAPQDTPGDGIALELALLEDARAQADILVDTSGLTIHDLRMQMESWFGQATGQGVAISLQSFSYKRGLPQGLDMAFDCRFLRNPHWQEDLRSLTGLDPRVADYVAQDKRYKEFHAKVMDLIMLMLPAVAQEGKAHFAIGFGCTGGKHRSVALVQAASEALAQSGWQVSIRHRELERRTARPMVGKDGS